MKEYYGNYIGIVVQNNDPEYAGKVKVFVPHISSTVYNDWIEGSDNKKIKFIGNNLEEDLTGILEELKPLLPWAECAAPLVGESSSGRFNNSNLTGSVSDSNFLKNITGAGENLDEAGAAPSNFYDETIRVNDAFDNAKNNINRPNPLSYNYKPNAYSNEAKGSFCIPAVGAHVWVFFREGNPNFPVYFAASFGQTDWKGIYETQEEPGVDYPGTYENKTFSETEYNNNVEAYRNKYVINQKGGSLEFINSDLNEKVRMTHYSGSFREMNNETDIEFSTKNKQGLVLNDSYETVRGFKNDYVGKDADEIVNRNKYKKVGSLNEEYFEKWKDVVGPIQDFKQLFETKRTLDNSVKSSSGLMLFKRNSSLQERSGTFADYPVTSTARQEKGLQNETNAAPGVQNDDGAASLDVAKAAATDQFISTSNYLTHSNQTFVNGTGKSLSTQDGSWDTDDRKDKLKDLIEASIPELTKIEQELGIGGSEIIQVTKHKVETIGMVMNDFGSIRYDGIGKLVPNEVLVGENVVFMNEIGSPLVELSHVQDLPGGNYNLNVGNRFNVMVGAGGLNLKSYGPTNITGSMTNITGQQVNIGAGAVDNDGEINLNAKTIDISGEILRLRNSIGRQVLVDSSLGVNKNVIIGGGLHVEGETFLQHVTAPKEYQVTETTEASLKTGASYTATIQGPAHSGTNGALQNGGIHTVTIVSSNNDVVKAHSHAFANLPLTLVGGNKPLRAAAISEGLNSGTARSVAEATHNEKK